MCISFMDDPVKTLICGLQGQRPLSRLKKCILSLAMTLFQTERKNWMKTQLKVTKARAIIMQGLDAKSLRFCLADRANPHLMWNRLQ